MKIGEAIQEIEERLGEENFEQAFGLMTLHIQFSFLREGIQQLDNERVTDAYNEFIDVIEKERKEFQEKELKNE